MNSPGSILHIILILHALDLQAIQGRPLFYGETNMNGREGGAFPSVPLLLFFTTLKL